MRPGAPFGEPEELLCSLLRGANPPIPEALAWDDLAECARARGVHLLLARRLHQSTTSHVPLQIQDRLAAALREESLVEELQAIDLRNVLTLLAASGVRPVLLKGTPLAYLYYAYPYLRPRLDVDLLIRREDIGTVRRTMEQAGYGRPNAVDGDLVTHQFQYAREGHAGVDHNYDFHWRVANPELFADVLSFETLDRSAVTVPALGEHARGPSLVHSLLLACVHRVAHHNDSGELIWLYDIHLMASRATDDEWGELELLAIGARMGAVCARGLSLAARAFGTELPDGSVDRLASAAGEASAAFIGGGLREVDVQLSNFRQLRSWGARYRMVRQHLFPSPAYILNSYNAGHRFWLPALYVHRMVRGAARWLCPLRR